MRSHDLSRAAIHFFIIGFAILIASGMPLLPAWTYAEGIQKSPDSQLFSVIFKFPKIILGMALLMVFPSIARWPKDFGKLSKAVLFATIPCAVVLLGPALAIGYVRPDAGIPPAALAWLACNLIFVCFGDEMFFRGYLQGRLSTALEAKGKSPWIAIVAVSVIFGLTHFRAGPALVGLSTLAALFYGWSYKRAGAWAAVLTHFGVNVIHFFFFSYPALIRI